MPLVQDQKTNPEEDKEFSLSKAMEFHEKSLDDFTQNERKKMQSLGKNIKILSEETEKLRLDLLEKDDIINELQTRIDDKNVEISNITESKNAIMDENKLLKCNLMINESKFTSLEIGYDEKVVGLEFEKNQIQQELENQRNSYNLLKEELTSTLRKVEDELLAKTNDLGNSIDKFEKLKTDFESYKIAINEEHTSIVNELKAEISEINNKLLQKQEELTRVLTEKCEMEETKNKIIDEQTFKINTIERVVEQPMHRVQPQLNKNSDVLNPITPFHFTEQIVIDPTNQSLQQTNRTRNSYQEVSNSQNQSIMSDRSSCEPTVLSAASIATINQAATITPSPSLPSISQMGPRHLKRLRTSIQKRIQNSQTLSTISNSNRQATNSRTTNNCHIIAYNIDESSSDTDVSIPSTAFRSVRREINNDRNNSFNSPQGFNIAERSIQKHPQFPSEFDLLKRSKFE